MCRKRAIHMSCDEGKARRGSVRWVIQTIHRMLQKGMVQTDGHNLPRMLSE